MSSNIYLVGIRGNGGKSYFDTELNLKGEENSKNKEWAIPSRALKLATTQYLFIMRVIIQCTVYIHQ